MGERSNNDLERDTGKRVHSNNHPYSVTSPATSETEPEAYRFGARRKRPAE